MKLVPALLLLLFPFFAVAQEAASEVKPLPNGGSARHRILLDERKAIADELTDAVNAHPKAEDKAASLETIRRLESNLHSIDAEIRKAATEAPTVVDFVSAPARSDRATTTGYENGFTAPVPDQPENALEKNTSYETWDVFQDFGFNPRPFRPGDMPQKRLPRSRTQLSP